MSILKSYRELIVWQKSIDLAKKIYALTQVFPKEEMYGLTSQLSGLAHKFGDVLCIRHIELIFFSMD